MHPDRNLGQEQDATRLFAKLQAAYEVLSDSQERAWYDSHHDAVLGDDEDTSRQHGEGGLRGTTATDIFKLLARVNGRLEYSDSPGGFFTVLRDTFSTLSQEEQAAGGLQGLEEVHYPSFGHASDSYDDVVRPFYAAWIGFSTQKSFFWKDRFPYHEAPDRRVRRLMEKKNKRLRDDGIREYNDAVRSLVAFVRKRDPRYISNKQSEEERQKVLRDAAAAQAARSRAAYQAKLEEHVQPDWAKPQESEEAGDGSGEADVEEHFECVACGKIFKSEKQYEAHEKSRKHLKSIQQLQRTMRREDREMSLDTPGSQPAQPALTTRDETVSGQSIESADEELGELEMDGADLALSLAPSNLVGNQTEPDSMPHARGGRDEANRVAEPQTLSNSDESDDEYASREKVEGRILGGRITKNSVDDVNVNDHVDDIETLSKVVPSLSFQDSDTGSGQKLGKAKQKKAKKAARRTGAGQGGTEVLLPLKYSLRS